MVKFCNNDFHVGHPPALSCRLQVDMTNMQSDFVRPVDDGMSSPSLRKFETKSDLLANRLDNHCGQFETIE